jgi:ribonuclease-3
MTSFSTRPLNPESVRLVSERQDEMAFQRLEFLGDRVLGAVTADMIFYRYPGVPVSVLAQKIAQMLSNQVLAGVALAHLGIASADTLEAYVGALYVEGGLEACRDWLAPILDDLDATPLERPWRTLLNTYAQQNKIDLDFHSRELNHKWICSLFFAGLRFDAYDHVRKQNAERDVARQACRHLQL